jgi:hypothetical protein
MKFMSAFKTGSLAGGGSFRCESCGYAVSLVQGDEVPVCPHCHGRQFRRGSMFADQTLTEPFMELGTREPTWLETARQSISVEGDYIAYEEGDQVSVVPLRKDWTRIGRSLAADIRFDDPTASRRHALVHREEGVARILDDRSLNGVFLNGERVEWHELRDGDEIVIGRFRLYFVRHIAYRLDSESKMGLGQSIG